MAKYPGEIYEPRIKKNRWGIEYKPEKETVGFVEDVVFLDEEVVAIETELGPNPKGEFENVVERLNNLYPKQATIWHDESNPLPTNVGQLRIFLSSLGKYCFTVAGTAAAPVWTNGDGFTTNTFFIKAGTYNFYQFGIVFSDYGKYDWYLDDVPLPNGQQQDWYNPTILYNRMKSFEITIPTSGNHILKAIANGKHVSSAGYRHGFEKFIITKQAIAWIT